MRYIRLAFLASLALVLIVVAFANRDPVTLRLLPDEIDRFWSVGRALTLPLFLVIFGAIVLGVMLGFVWEWLREHKYRADAEHERRERERLSREVNRLKGASAEGQDEILRLLEPGGRR